MKVQIDMLFKSALTLTTLIFLSNFLVGSMAFAVSEDNSESATTKVQQICATGDHMLDESCGHPLMQGISLHAAHMFKEDPRDPAYRIHRIPQMSEDKTDADSK